MDAPEESSTTTREPRRFLLTLIAMVGANAAAGTLFSWSVLLTPISEDLGAPVQELSTVFSTALVAFALAVTISGRAVDRHGTRVTTAAAGFLVGLGLAVAGTGTSPIFLHLGIGALFGFGSGLTYLSVVAWADARGRGRHWLVGVVVAAYAAGPVVGAPLGTLATAHLGWRVTLVLGGAVVTGMILLASGGMPGRRDAAPAGELGSWSGTVTGTRGLGALWVLFLGMFVPGLLVFAHAASIAEERGMSAAAAGGVVSVLALGNVGGRLLAAPLATRFEVRGALWVTWVILVAALVPLASVPSRDVVMLSLPLLGVQYGVASALLPMATRAVSGGSRFASVYGRVFSSWGVAGILGPSVLGVALDGDGSRRAFQLSLLAAGLAVPALVVLGRRLKAHR